MWLNANNVKRSKKNFPDRVENKLELLENTRENWGENKLFKSCNRLFFR